MKISNLDLLKSVGALQMLGNLHLPVKTSYSLGKLMRTVDEKTADYERTRLSLVKQFGKKCESGAVLEEKDPASGQMVAVFDDRAGFDAALKELQEITVEFDVTPLKIDDLGNVNLPASILASLYWLIVE